MGPLFKDFFLSFCYPVCHACITVSSFCFICHACMYTCVEKDRISLLSQDSVSLESNGWQQSQLVE